MGSTYVVSLFKGLGNRVFAAVSSAASNRLRKSVWLVRVLSVCECWAGSRREKGPTPAELIEGSNLTLKSPPVMVG